MSYRNPQIIVDRSAEIWAQAATQFGQTLATGVDNYYKAKKEAEEKKKKIDDAKQLYRNKALLRSQKELNEAASKIKDPGLLEQFKTISINLLNKGEDFTYKGVTYNIGAIDAETELAINPNLTADERAAYTQIAMSASTYQTSMLEKTGAVIANLEPLKESGAYQIGSKIDIAGQGTDEYKNLVASNSLLNQSVDGVETKKELIRRKNEDGSYSNIVSINASFDTKSDVWKQLKDAYNLTDEDANFTWERDVDKWAGEGSLVVKLEPDVDTDEALQAAGFIDDKHNQTSKGFVSKNITTRTVQDGRDFVTSESHFDVDQLRNDQVYRDALAGKASNILAMEQDQVVKYVGNNLGWGDKITAETLYGKNITEDQRQAFIEEQLFENKYQTRQAKQSDVDAYNNDVNIAKDIEAGKTQPLQVGDTVYYNVTDTTSTKIDTSGDQTSSEKKLEQFDQSVVDLTKQLSSSVINKLNQGQALTQNDVVPMLSRLSKIENAEGEVLKLQPLRPGVTAGSADTGAGYYTVQTNLMETLPDGTQRRVTDASRLSSQEAIDKAKQLKEQNPENEYTYMPYLVVNYKSVNPEYASASDKRRIPKFIFTEDVYNLNSGEDINNLRLNVGRAYKSPTQEREAVTKYDKYKVK
jgi:hypothetical protein